ncbi:hypothetical protein K493DRAFT_250939 [Basidiobolus meristosporus CBS 931.73]|uniref:RhoGAP-domain-containing protein n=1 Tax=Basidiobolus meristosporus CBS 931.73 TaxID=1314790 RepID=A0A1Y1ZCL2_9FUNG|nr:hypothetical protein K493DRAFT_250939 [Basidiobolus meristosporus CBS 931.73]|eukprot:ORY07717.1 hypothetical protein K493DRAFT_250939 [Basidiobolus meristosporus CBS 931.73]
MNSPVHSLSRFFRSTRNSIIGRDKQYPTTSPSPPPPPESPTTTGPNEWVDFQLPNDSEMYYINPVTGECIRNLPPNANLNSNGTDGQWWELYDPEHQLNFYFNSSTDQAEWLKPEDVDIIPLSLVQKNSLGQKVLMKISMKAASKIAGTDIKALGIDRQVNTSHSPLGLSLGGPVGDTGTLRKERAGRLSSPTLPSVPHTAPIQSSPLSRADEWSEPSTDHSDHSPERLAPSSNLTPVRKSVLVANNARRSGISSPVLNPDAAAAMHPHNSHQETAPIVLPQRVQSLLPPSRHNGHASLPSQLVVEIEQFQIDGFAKKYFATHKRGIFRRKVPMEKMLQWTKDSIKQPLMVLNKNVHRDALKCFKLIQRVMGDRVRTKNNELRDIQWLLDRGIVFGELRDEIYVQMCKQLTNNPHPIVTVVFPASKNFEEYLKTFYRAHFQSSEPKIPLMAKHCYNKLMRISKSGPRGKIPSSTEIEQAKDAAFYPSVFGDTLENFMEQQKEQHPELPLPHILLFLAGAVLKLGGLHSEGIFRLSGDPEFVNQLRLNLEKQKYDLEGIADPNSPSSLLKLWLRDLSEPLIPIEFYDKCLLFAENPQEAIQLIGNLPDINRQVVHFMISYLQMFLTDEATSSTKMSVSNIAMIFAPNFLRCPSENLNEIFEKTRYEQAYIRTLLLEMRPKPLVTLNPESGEIIMTNTSSPKLVEAIESTQID